MHSPADHTYNNPPMQADGLALREEPVCLQQALEAVCEMAAPSAAAKGLELALLVDGGGGSASGSSSDAGDAGNAGGSGSGSGGGGSSSTSPPRHFLGDATRLRQVLHHLVSNAVKYTDSGAVVVRARRVPGANGSGSGGGGSGGQAGNGEGLEISVTDTGIGMSEELLGGLFQSFRTGNDALNRRYGGTGLGLALSKRLAEAMRGELRVESAPGRGSTFTLALRPAWCDAGGGSGSGGAAAAAADDSSDEPSSTVAATGGGGGSSSTLSTACGAPISADASSSASSSAGGGSGSSSGGGGGGGGVRPLSISSGDTDADGCSCGCAAAYASSLAQLAGGAVFVDVAQPLLSEQVCQMLTQLGLRAVASPPGAGAGAADAAVVSPCRVPGALRRGWRGRPLVVVGAADELPERLHPLVITAGRPLRMGRLVAALQRAAGMLSWNGGAEHAPRLGRTPPAGGGGALSAGLGGGRWRARASIDNSALRQSPLLTAPAAAAAVSPPALATAGPFPALGEPLQQPPPLDLTSAAAPLGGSRGSGGAGPRTTAAVLRGLAAVRSAFTPGARRASQDGGTSSAAMPAAPAPAPTAERPPPAPAPPQPPQQQPTSGAQPPPPGRRLPRVLIAEDNAVNVLVLKKVLQAVLPGVRPDVVGNGLQAVEAAAREAYDLILM